MQLWHFDCKATQKFSLIKIVQYYEIDRAMLGDIMVSLFKILFMQFWHESEPFLQTVLGVKNI